MGAAISLFDGTTAVKVPRTRFFPVKSCNDLLSLRSDCYVLDTKENLRINPKRAAASRLDIIKIQLDPDFYGKIDLLEERFKEGLPSLVNCESLNIEGDVYFEGDVTIKDSVSIKNSHASPAVIKKGSIIDKDIVF
jgi:UTP--glucose-1-phosphate uridylyltransferase